MLLSPVVHPFTNTTGEDCENASHIESALLVLLSLMRTLFISQTLATEFMSLGVSLMYPLGMKKELAGC